jgi:hypothetical protein
MRLYPSDRAALKRRRQWLDLATMRRRPRAAKVGYSPALKARPAHAQAREAAPLSKVLPDSLKSPVNAGFHVEDSALCPAYRFV